ncbi:MAG: 16S rRNA (cytosine(967)-C(5))-methyltransferase RsmB [Lachnospiraceae bacterium]|nr:16S rRNA (cytosine(967)-C(5))-methyltransferase RsmB [Lachnospiraceae bacterium]MDY5742632.1 16S rRNA (cytosine(967)-C(5))-methyltransferase RsmB [Lachnospiraceae bacterium]
MIKSENTRLIVLELLLTMEKEQLPSHVAISACLDKYSYLPRQDRAFIKRLTEGTLEYRLQLDYLLGRFSSVAVKDLRLPILMILRLSLYQILYMDRVPDSAAVNEAVQLTQKKGFFPLKGFVNGVLRTVIRHKDSLPWPDRNDLVACLSVGYSMPVWLVDKWIHEQGYKATKAMLKAFLAPKDLVVRMNIGCFAEAEILDSLKRQNIFYARLDFPDYGLRLSGYESVEQIKAFCDGMIQVQDRSSMLVGAVAGVKGGELILDICAAPGGKCLHLADRLVGCGRGGRVIARDISESKVALIRENAARTPELPVDAEVFDATVSDAALLEQADIVIADVPCSGLGVIGRKPDIKYRMTDWQIEELVSLQRKILEQAVRYVKPGGTLIFSTCTVSRQENEENVKWLLENLPLALDSLEPYLPGYLHTSQSRTGYLQLLPQEGKGDGFFIARLKRVQL